MNTTLNKSDAFIGIIIFLLTFLLGSNLLTPEVVGLFHDDAIYIATAKAIAEVGRYSVPFLPLEIPQTKYPPVHPLLLSLVWKLAPTFPENAIFFQLISLCFCSLSLSLAYFALVRRGYTQRLNAIMGIALVGTSHLYLYFGSVPMSEMTFACIAIFSFILFEKAINPTKANSGVLLFINGIVLGALTLTRTAGIFFFPLYLYFTYKKKVNTSLFVLGFFISIAPWLFWTSSQESISSSRFDLSYYSGYLSWLDSVFPILYKIILFNFTEMNLILPLALFESFSVFASDSNPIWILIIFLYGFFIVGWINQWRGKKFIVIVSIPYLLALLIWPGPPLRMVIPLLPILLPIMIEGSILILNKVKFSRLLKYGLYSFLIVAIVSNLIRLSDYKALNKQTNFPYLEIPIADEIVYWEDYKKAFLWITTNTKKSDLVISNFDPLVYLYTGRKSIMPYKLEPARWIYGDGKEPLGSNEEIMKHIFSIKGRYLLILPMPAESNRKYFGQLIRDLANQYPSNFKLRYKGLDSRFEIYELSTD